MRILIIAFFILGCHAILEGQNVKEAIDKGIIGFSCSFGGTPSMSVRKLSRMISKSEFIEIIELLDSNNNAEKYLAVFTIEKLEKLGKIKLTWIEKLKISAIYNSNDIVFLCSGCFFFGPVSLKKIMVIRDRNSFYEKTQRWLDGEFSTVLSLKN